MVSRPAVVVTDAASQVQTAYSSGRHRAVTQRLQGRLSRLYCGVSRTCTPYGMSDVGSNPCFVVDSVQPAWQPRQLCSGHTSCIHPLRGSATATRGEGGGGGQSCLMPFANCWVVRSKAARHVGKLCCGLPGVHPAAGHKQRRGAGGRPRGHSRLAARHQCDAAGGGRAPAVTRNARYGKFLTKDCSRSFLRRQSLKIVVVMNGQNRVQCWLLVVSCIVRC